MLPRSTETCETQCNKSLTGEKHGIHRESPGQNLNRGENRMCFFLKRHLNRGNLMPLVTGLAFWPEEQVWTNTATLCEV